jgi:hypothetical protein
MVTQTPADVRELLGTTAPLPAATFPVPPDPERPLTAAQLDAAAAVTEAEDLKARLASMAEAVRKGATVMPVDEAIAQAQQLGQRELRRRRARRKARRS